MITLIKNRVHGDARGWFTESYSAARLKALGLALDFVQDNHSFSARKGTLRGLHFQSPPFAQDKLVRCLRGRLLDVVVDLRRGSPSYGHWLSVELDARNHQLLLVPKGFGHGFMTLEDDTEIFYKVTAPYAPAHDHGVRFDDPQIGITWPLPPDPASISPKDASLPLLKDLQSPFEYDGTAFELRSVE